MDNPKCKQYLRSGRSGESQILGKLELGTPTVNCVCTRIEPDTLASAKVRRISGLKWASLPRWIRKSIPTLRGPGPVNNNRTKVVLRKPHLFDTDSLVVTLALGEIFDKDNSNVLLHNKQVYLQYFMKVLIRKAPGRSQPVNSFSPKSQNHSNFVTNPTADQM